MSDRVGDRTLRDLLDERASRRPDHPFLVFEDAGGAVREYSYAEFTSVVDAAAAGLADLGVQPGTKVTLHLRNCPEFLFAWFGLATIGGVAVPSNVANTADELRYVLDYSDSELLITEPLLLETARAAAGGVAAVRHVLRTDESEAWMPAGGEPPRPALGSEDPVEILFTSGTTSRPKGVVLTHANCLWSGERVAAAMTLGDDARCLTSLPTFHVNAQSVTVLSALTAGGTCILLQEFSARRFWEPDARPPGNTDQPRGDAVADVCWRSRRRPTDTDHSARSGSSTPSTSPTTRRSASRSASAWS